jgi:hypothetical protein
VPDPDMVKVTKQEIPANSTARLETVKEKKQQLLK